MRGDHKRERGEERRREGGRRGRKRRREGKGRRRRKGRRGRKATNREMKWNGGPTRTEDCFLSPFIQRRREWLTQCQQGLPTAKYRQSYAEFSM